MQTTNLGNQSINECLAEIYKLLQVIQSNQQNELTIIQKNHATNMKKIMKLQEYNQIADMTNQIFELRITGIEEAIKRIK